MQVAGNGLRLDRRMAHFNKDLISRLKRTNARHLSLEEAMQESSGRKPWGETTRAE
jgi:hypothetical protein